MAKRRKHDLTLQEVIDRTAVDASKVARRVGEEIRGDILRLSRDLEIHRRAGDREKVEKAVRARIRRMNADLSRVMDVALGRAVKDANAETGLAVKYSADYTREILAMVQEQQGENLASVYSRKMEQSIIAALRNATVGTIQEAAVAGLSYGEQKKLMQERWEAACKGLGDARFIDSGGHEWDSRDYFAMNVRTNAMRVYNDVLAGNVAKDGGDLVQVTRHGDPNCKLCFPWEGRILSLTGKTKGYPTYEECRAAGCFHPNCTHSIQTVDELIDADEIELQRGKESPDEADDPMKAAFDLDVARKQRDGMGKDEAEAAVRRERLEAAARFGMPVEGAERVVQGLTDGEVAALTDGVKVPKFSMAKRHEEPRFTPGSAGGHVVMPRGELTAEALKELPGVEKRLSPPKPPEEEPRKVQTGTPKTLQHLPDRLVVAEQRLRTLIEQDEDLSMSYEELEKKAEEFIAAARENGSPGMYIRTDAIIEAIKGGTFKSQFETGTSSGLLNGEVRKSVAEQVFGIDTKALERDEHEKYGVLIDRDIRDDFAEKRGYDGSPGSRARVYAFTRAEDNLTVTDYGACVRFKPDSVMATFTVNDSLNNYQGRPDMREASAAPMLDKPKLTGFVGEGLESLYALQDANLRDVADTPSPSAVTDMLYAGYIELQYHGKLAASQVESINFHEARSAQRFYDAAGDRCAKLGIEIMVEGEAFKPKK